MSSSDLADMQLKSRCNKGIRFLLCVIDVFSKYALIIIPLKDKKKWNYYKIFQNMLEGSSRKPNKTWVDKGSEI